MKATHAILTNKRIEKPSIYVIIIIFFSCINHIALGQTESIYAVINPSNMQALSFPSSGTSRGNTINLGGTNRIISEVNVWISNDNASSFNLTCNIWSTCPAPIPSSSSTICGNTATLLATSTITVPSSYNMTMLTIPIDPIDITSATELNVSFDIPTASSYSGLGLPIGWTTSVGTTNGAYTKCGNPQGGNGCFFSTIPSTPTNNHSFLVRAIEPTAVCKDVSVELDNTGNAPIAIQDIYQYDVNNSQISSISASPAMTFSCLDVGEKKVTLTVQNSSGLTTDCISTITIKYNSSEPDPDIDGITGVCDLCPSEPDTALDFDGIDDYVEVPHNNDLNMAVGEFSFGAWIYPRDNGYNTIVSKGNGEGAQTGYILRVSAEAHPIGAGRLGLLLCENSGFCQWNYGNTNIPENTWTHVGVSVDNTSANPIVNFYINGVNDGSQSYTLSNDLYNSDTNAMYIGRQGSVCNCHFFNGKIDDLALWNKSVTANDMLASVNYPLSPNIPGLVSYYDVDVPYACANNAGVTPSILDKVASNHGSLENFSLVGCESNYTYGENIGACDDYCPINYAGANSLTGTPLADTDYETSGNIESDQIITSPLVVDYDAATKITLMQNFRVEAGARFRAFIDGCDNL